MQSFLILISTILNIYFYIVIASVVLSWLLAFNIVNPHNEFVRQIRYFVYRLTEPLLGPIRRVLPDLGGLDLSPMVLLLGIIFARNLIAEYGPRLL